MIAACPKCAARYRIGREHLKPEGAACFMEAQHLCMIIRGAAKKSSRVITSVVAGCFEEPKRREELFRLISTRLR